MNCLVLGGAGFIGSHIVDALLLNGHSVRVFDLPNISLVNLKHHGKSIEIVTGDFSNIEDVDQALHDMDIVIHLVSTTLPGPSNQNIVYDIETNLISTVNLLHRAVVKKVKKMIFASSGGTVYGIPAQIPIPETHPTNPICSYGIGKLAIEKYLSLFHHLHGMEYLILRLGNPYGPRQRMEWAQGAIAVFLGNILKQKPITIWGDGNVARDYFYIEDLKRAFLLAVEKDIRSKTINIASGEAVTLIDLLSCMKEVTGYDPEINFVQARKLDVPTNCLNIMLAEELLSWKPKVNLKAGITKTWAWLKNDQ